MYDAYNENVHKTHEEIVDDLVTDALWIRMDILYSDIVNVGTEERISKLQQMIEIVCRIEELFPSSDRM